jgi:hypothetical protein
MVSCAVAATLASFASLSSFADPAVVSSGSFSVPFAQTFWVECANGGLGEEVSLDGLMHFRYVETVNGNRYTYTENVNPQGLTGTGQVTGDVYRANGKTSFSYSGDLADDAPEQFTYVNRVHLVGPRTGNDLFFKFTEHMTVNPSGEVIVEFQLEGFTCR